LVSHEEGSDLLLGAEKDGFPQAACGAKKVKVDPPFLGNISLLEEPEGRKVWKKLDGVPVSINRPGKRT